MPEFIPFKTEVSLSGREMLGRDILNVLAEAAAEQGLSFVEVDVEKIAIGLAPYSEIQGYNHTLVEVGNNTPGTGGITDAWIKRGETYRNLYLELSDNNKRDNFRNYLQAVSKVIEARYPIKAEK